MDHTVSSPTQDYKISSLRDELFSDIAGLKEEKIQVKGTPVNSLYNAWVEVDLDAIAYNIQTIRSILNSTTKLLVVVKGDGYGHGLREVSKVVLNVGADFLGVTSIADALELRKLYPEVPILILSAGMYAHSELIVKYDLRPVLCSRNMADLLNITALKYGKKCKVHVKVDTGMGRLGSWYENAPEFIRYVKSLPGLEIEGLCSHFSSVSSNAVDMAFSKLQIARFMKLVSLMGKQGIHIPIKHIANTGAVLLLKESQLDMVRIGISAYGLYPSGDFDRVLDLRPALSVKSRIGFLKEVKPGRAISYGRTYVVKKKTKIATVPIGYSHGYLRCLSNRAYVLVRGKRVPVVGIITMDQIMIDVGDSEDIKVGDEVVLIGKQGDGEISVYEVAEWAQTIPYEILSRLNLPRVYFRDCV